MWLSSPTPVKPSYLRWILPTCSTGAPLQCAILNHAFTFFDVATTALKKPDFIAQYFPADAYFHLPSPFSLLSVDAACSPCSRVPCKRTVDSCPTLDSFSPSHSTSRHASSAIATSTCNMFCVHLICTYRFQRSVSQAQRLSSVSFGSSFV